jgi:hypothetical protein
MSEAKEIRFIDPHYNELFRIPDGGRIAVTRPDGEQWVGVCKYLDECHFEINGECLHICQFAEIQQRIGATYMPEPETETIGGYRVTRRTFVGGKVFKLGHNPDAAQPYATWQGCQSDPTRNDWGHYWQDKSTANRDLFLRADSERTGRAYDHTTLITPKARDKNRDDMCR